MILGYESTYLTFAMDFGNLFVPRNKIMFSKHFFYITHSFADKKLVIYLLTTYR